MPDHYAILGVQPTATKDEIKHAYRAAAKRWHPDRNKAPSAAESFRQATEAYHVLSDELARARYDQTRLGGDLFGALNGLFGGAFTPAQPSAQPSAQWVDIDNKGQQRPSCPRCMGLGYVMGRQGFFSIKIPCGCSR